MNTWGYLILISALFIVAALMLYARFASRSREKSLHHAPAENAAVEDEWEDSVTVSLEEIEEAAEEITLEQEEGNVVVKIEKREDESKPVEKAEYFDELQEAAAGLAMLMRSSPVSDRATPVVFAPEEEELIAIEKIEIPKEESDEQEISEPVLDEAIVEETPSPDVASPNIGESGTAALNPSEEAAGSDEPASNEIAAEAADEVAKIEEVAAEISSLEPNLVEPEEALVESPVDEDFISIAAILGEEVNEQILHIDSGLDALEELVASIEVSLAELDPVGDLDSQVEAEPEAMAVEFAA